MASDVLVIGAGPAGLVAAWTAHRRGARVKVLAAGIGTTHIMPGWLGVLDTAEPLGAGLERWIAMHPEHPYALAGADAIRAGIFMLRQACEPAGLSYAGDPDLNGNFVLPTALGATVRAAFVPESFAAGDLRDGGSMLIAGPDGWRDFYPALCAANLARQGHAARAYAFALPEGETSKFDITPSGLARLFERTEIRERLAYLLKPRLEGAKRVGFPAVLGLERHADTWRDLQDRLGVPVFEIPTLPPSVPGMRLYAVLKRALEGAGVQLLFDMAAAGGDVTGGRCTGVRVPGATRRSTYSAERIILATGGLYGGGITSDHHGILREVVLDLPVVTPGGLGDWFDSSFLGSSSHRIHAAGVRANRTLQPVDVDGRVLIDNVRVAGRLLAGCQPLAEGSTEGVWLATAYRAAC